MILALVALQSVTAEQTRAQTQVQQRPGSSDAPVAPTGGTARPGAALPGDTPTTQARAPLRLPRAATPVALPSVNAPAVVADRPGTDRLTTVNGRRRPDYDPAGLRAGAFLVYPQVSSSLGYDSNVYRQTSGRFDAVAHVRGEVQARTDLSRHALMLDGFVDERKYFKYTSEDFLAYRAHALGRLDIARDDQVSLDLEHSRDVVERGATGEILQTRQPVRFSLSAAQLAGRKAFGRLSAGLSGRIAYTDFQNAETPAGVPLDQQYRDNTLYEVVADAGYALAAGPQLFVSVSGAATRFRVVSPIIRDNDVVEVLGGVRSDITPLLRGQIGIGYIHADFKDPTIASRGALGLNIAVNYLVTPLTTVNVSARRQLQNVASVTAPAALVTAGQIGVDHELLRNLILSAGAGYQTADYIAGGGTVQRITADGGARWLVSRHIQADLSLSYQRRTGGRLVARDFDQARATAGLAYRF